nr:immunoglobulin heavy chain junction region [Macaca mulatta]
CSTGIMGADDYW